jgi:hypothetical protein
MADVQGGLGDMPLFDIHNGDENNVRALNLILDAWDQGTECGVLPEQMAYAALFAALTDLVALFGEEAVMKLTRGLETRIEHGEFSLDRVRH